MKSTASNYGRLARFLHWFSALLIILLIPMGFLMQNAGSEATKMFWYKIHVIVGITILLLTLLRIIWRFIDTSPDLPAGMSSVHQLAFKGVHILLYLFLLALVVSGLGLNITSGLGEILFAGAPGPIPTDFSEYLPRIAHGLTSRIYIALLIAHIGGVIMYQLKEGDVMGRIGPVLPTGGKTG